MMKNYLLKLLEQCSEEQFGQDAIEWAIVAGRLPLTYDLERDVQEAMSRYDEIIEAYRSSARPVEAERKPHAPIKHATTARRVKATRSHAPVSRRKIA